MKIGEHRTAQIHEVGEEGQREKKRKACLRRKK